MINLYRDRSSLAVRMFQLSVMSFFIWLYLIRLKHNQASIQDRNGLIFQCLQVPPYVGLLNSVTVCKYSRQHPLGVRHFEKKQYHLTVYTYHTRGI